MRPSQLPRLKWHSVKVKVELVNKDFCRSCEANFSLGVFVPIQESDGVKEMDICLA
jgi:hypothetical protein